MSKIGVVDVGQFATGSSQQGCAEFLSKVEGVLNGRHTTCQHLTFRANCANCRSASLSRC